MEMTMDAQEELNLDLLENPWRLVQFMEDASNSIMNSCLEFDDIWDDAYESATRIICTRREQFRKTASRSGR